MTNYIGKPSWILAIVCFVFLVTGLKLSKAPLRKLASPGRLASLDGMRGILATSVFFHHFSIFYQYKNKGMWTDPQSNFYTLIGQIGVTAFFMITGFLFVGKIKAVRGKLDLNRFFVGRVFRIMPLYYFSVVLIYLICFTQTGFSFKEAIGNSLDGWLLFQSAVINQYPITGAVNAGVQWTLTYEWVFYFSLPAIAWIWTALELRSWVVFLLATFMICNVKAPLEVPLLHINTQMLAPFAIGGLVSELGQLDLLRRIANSLWGTLAFVFAGILLFLGYRTAYAPGAYLLQATMFAPVALGNSIFGLLKTKTMTFLGDISYDIYLLHGIVIFTLFEVIAPKALVGLSSPWLLFAFMLLSGAITLAVSFLTHFLVEQPMLRLGSRIVVIDRIQDLAAP